MEPDAYLNVSRLTVMIGSGEIETIGFRTRRGRVAGATGKSSRVACVEDCGCEASLRLKVRAAHPPRLRLRSHSHFHSLSLSHCHLHLTACVWCCQAQTTVRRSPMVLVYPPQLASTDRRAAPPENDYGTAYRAIVRAARGAKIVGLKRTAALTTADEGDTWLDPAAARLGAAATAVLLLVAADVDALAAARVLARLLTDDDVPYRIVPVEGYASLAQIIKQHVVSNDLLRSVVFLNLGSLLSLSTYFRTAQSGQDPDSDANSALSDDEDELTRLPLPPLCTVHVIDSHRPWNLDSLYATSDIMDRICIWDDGGAADLTDVAEAYDMLEFDDGLDTEDESDNEDDDDRSDRSDEDVNVDEDEGEVRPRKKSRLGTDGLPLSPGHPTKPKRLTDHARAVYQNVLTRYYERGTTMGRSVAAMLWMMAEGLGRVDNEILWYVLSCVFFLLRVASG